MDRRSHYVFPVAAALAAMLLFAASGATSAGRDLAERGSPERLELGDRTYAATLVFRDDFTSLAHWLVEGGAELRAGGGRLRVHGLGAVATLWCRTPLHGPLVVQYDVRVGEGAGNVNLFAYARHDEGLLETSSSRTGRYAEYRSFPNYIVTYLPAEDTGPWRVRFRKNPGFSLLEEEAAPPVPAGQTATVAYRFDAAGGVQLYLNGDLVFEAEDSERPLTSGYFALRTWNSELTYSDFRVYSLLDAGAPRGEAGAP